MKKKTPSGQTKPKLSSSQGHKGMTSQKINQSINLTPGPHPSPWQLTPSHVRSFFFPDNIDNSCCHWQPRASGYWHAALRRRQDYTGHAPAPPLYYLAHLHENRMEELRPHGENGLPSLAVWANISLEIYFMEMAGYGFFHLLMASWFVTMLVCLLLSRLMYQQHACLSQGQICYNNCMRCHTETENVNQTCCLGYTDTRQTIPSTDPMTLGTQRTNHYRISFYVTVWHHRGSHWARCLASCSDVGSTFLGASGRGDFPLRVHMGSDSIP